MLSKECRKRVCWALVALSLLLVALLSVILFEPASLFNLPAEIPLSRASGE